MMVGMPRCFRSRRLVVALGSGWMLGINDTPLTEPLIGVDFEYGHYPSHTH